MYIFTPQLNKVVNQLIAYKYLYCVAGPNTSCMVLPTEGFGSNDNLLSNNSSGITDNNNNNNNNNNNSNTIAPTNASTPITSSSTINNSSNNNPSTNSSITNGYNIADGGLLKLQWDSSIAEICLNIRKIWCWKESRPAVAIVTELVRIYKYIYVLGGACCLLMTVGTDERTTKGGIDE